MNASSFGFLGVPRPSRPPRIRMSAVLVVMLALAGCGVQGVTLPGGAGRDGYRVTVQFGDVLDLVPQAAVKVDDVTVGSVDRIRLVDFTAEVGLQIERGVRLPDNTVASIRQSSLLGEKFVSLGPPTGTPAQGRLSDGDVIPLARSGRSIEVEEVFAALSLLLNGGGIEQLRTINRELSAALSGREDKLRSLLTQLDMFVGGLDDQKADIIRALEGLDRLTATLNAQQQTIATALDDIGPGLRVLADQRVQLVQMLQALSKLGVVGTRVIKASREDTLADLRALQPILDQLARAGNYLPKALEIMLTFPFPRTIQDGVRGDFTNLYATADLDLRNVLRNLTVEPPPPANGDPLPTPSAPAAPTLPTLPGVLPSPSVPPLPGTPGESSPDLAELLLGGLLG
jgi:phospholipid/cholesterol/gamma-HCH transport system substrate-binding protein